MLRSVAGKALWDRRRSLVVWVLGVAALVGMYAGLYPSMSDNSAYSDVINQMPSSLRDLFSAGVSTDYTSGTGYLSLELMSFMAPLIVIAYAVGAGSSAVAGEEERHTLDLVLATPVTRGRLVVEQFVAMVAGVLLLTIGMDVALIAFGAAAGMGLAAGHVTAAMLHLALLGIVFGAFALAIGAGTGRLGLARGLPALVAVVTYIVNGFAPSVSWLEPVQKLSPFYQYVGHDPLRHGLSGAALLVSVATVAVLVAVAVWSMRRRDTA
jgi:ABC-2 type transport system permease protein